MNVVLREEQYNIANIYYGEAIQNVIIENSLFIKIIYSNNNIMTAGLFILVSLKNITKELYFKKIKITYDNNINTTMLNRIYVIETEILNKYNSTKKQKKLLYETLSSGVIKLYPNKEDDILNISNSFTLKISGIWESDTEYGITYKLLCT
jgi:hypothetical protein